MADHSDATPTAPRLAVAATAPVLLIADDRHCASDPERALLAPTLARAHLHGVDVRSRPVSGVRCAGAACATTRLAGASETDSAADAYVAGALRPLFANRLSELRYRRSHERAWRTRCAGEAERLAELATPGRRIVLHGIEALGVAAALPPRAAIRLALLLDAAIPAPELLAQLPGHERLFAALARFDLVAVPSERDASCLRAYCARELDATLLSGGALRLRGRALRIVVQPTGIDARARAALAASATVPRTAAELFALDAVDASRALVPRLRAFSRLLARPGEARRPSLLQLLAPIAPDPFARALRRRVQAFATRIDGRHGEPHAVCVRCVEWDGDVDALAGMQRASRVGLCTPVADAAAIGAQDWVACQDPADPGVLLLSRHASAAPWLDGALLVDARDPGDVATAMERALAMPLSERRNRWQCAWQSVLRRDGAHWLPSLLAHWRDEAPREPVVPRLQAARPAAVATLDPVR